MGDIKIRIKQIRTDIKLTQKQMSGKIGVTEATVSRMESGKSSITEQTIKMICNEFSINETWLRTGEGEMYIISEQDKKIADTLAKKIVKLDKKSIDRINDLIDLLLEKENQI